MQDVIVIGGAPCSGKSTLAKMLAIDGKKKIAHLDDLREEFQQTHIAQKNQYPWIFASFGLTAEEFWKYRTPAAALEVEIQQAKEFWPTVQSYIHGGEFDILEGVQLLPELIHRDFGHTMPVVFLIDANQERVASIIQQRGLWGDADTYADWIKPLEAEWVQLHNEWLQKEAVRYHFPIVQIGDRSATLSQVITALQTFSS